MKTHSQNGISRIFLCTHYLLSWYNWERSASLLLIRHFYIITFPSAFSKLLLTQKMLQFPHQLSSPLLDSLHYWGVPNWNVWKDRPKAFNWYIQNMLLLDKHFCTDISTMVKTFLLLLRHLICSQSLISLEQLLPSQLMWQIPRTWQRATPRFRTNTNRSLSSCWLPIYYVHDRKDCYINKHNDFHSIPPAIFIQTT